MIQKNNHIRLWDMLNYSVANLGYGVISQMIASYLVFYATVILRVPGSLIGIIVAISVIWDAVSDPFMGYISDISQSKYGRRHYYIFIGTIGIAAANLFLWDLSPDLSLFSKFLILMIVVLSLKTFITIFVTPYTALGAELSTDYNERSMIQAIKTIFFLIAVSLVTAGAMFVLFKSTKAYPVGQLNPDAYRRMAIIGSVIMLLTGMFTFFKTRKFIPMIPKATEDFKHFSIKTFYAKIRFSLSQSDYRAVFLGYLFTNIASAIIGTIGLHTYTYTFLLNNNEMGIVIGVQFLTSIVSQPIWAKIAQKKDKGNAVRIGLKLSILGCLVLFVSVLLRESIQVHYQFLLIYAIVIGFGSSGLFSIPLSMIADTVDQQEFLTGERNEGIYYGMLTFGYKISQAIAIFMFGVILDLIRFNPSLVEQLSSTGFLLGALLSLGSLMTFIFAYIAYTHYTLNEAGVKAIQEKLKEITIQKKI